MLPVWAALGPFKSGKDSASALNYAYMAIMGPEEAEKISQEVSLHAVAYKSNPEKWEKVRQEAASEIGPDLEDFIALAKGFQAMDSLNEEILLEGGHKLEPQRKPDGTLGIAYKQTMSDEAIEEKRHKRGEEIFHGIGESLLNDSSKEGCALVGFLTKVYKMSSGKEDVSAAAIGKIWFACQAEDPQSELLQEFEKLNEAYKAINSDLMDSDLEWSNNPGAHEIHLKRRQNNPYFPESRRVISKEDLELTQKKDQSDFQTCQQRFENLASDFQKIVTSRDWLKIRERLDTLISFSIGVGGSAKEIETRALELREILMSVLRKTLANDQEKLGKLEFANSIHRDFIKERLNYPVIAQMCREGSPVLKEETTSTILSENPETISTFLNTLPEDNRSLIRVEALKMLKEALNGGFKDPQLEEKISILTEET